MAAHLGTAEVATAFHAGYSLATFFESFPALRRDIDVSSLDAVAPFLTEDELASIQTPTLAATDEALA